jgi:hypothetical protein
MVFFIFPEDARWNREAVEFSVIIGSYEGTVRVPRRVFQRLLDQSPTPRSGASKRSISSARGSS